MTDSNKTQPAECDCMDRDEVADLILISPETGKGMRVVSPVEEVDGLSVFLVGNLNERWRVTVRLEESSR